MLLFECPLCILMQFHFWQNISDFFSSTYPWCFSFLSSWKGAHTTGYSFYSCEVLIGLTPFEQDTCKFLVRVSQFCMSGNQGLKEITEWAFLIVWWRANFVKIFRSCWPFETNLLFVGWIVAGAEAKGDIGEICPSSNFFV